LSSNLVLYICYQHLMVLQEKILILISRSSIWFVLEWNQMELTKNMLSWSFPFLFKRGSKGMAFLHSRRFNWNMEWHEEDLPWEVFPSISSSQYKKRNMWDSAISWRDTFRVLGKIWAIVYSMPSSSNTRSAAHSIFLWRINAYWLVVSLILQVEGHW